MRRCLDCRRPSNTSRCPACTSRRKAVRNADAPLAAELCARATHCARCGVELTHHDPQGPHGPTAQHTAPVSRGGRLQPTDPVWCRACNASVGARVGEG